VIEITPRPEGVLFRVRAQPGASGNRIVGPYDGALKVAVSAPPEKGKANEEIRRLLARTLGLPARDLLLVGGEFSRDKKFLVRNLTADALRQRIQEIRW
jgi:uncharacterized protein (TIGR00251 family)